MFTIKKVGENYIIIIPMYSNNKIIKFMPYLNKILYDNNVDWVVLSNSLKNIEGIQESIYKANINILNGKIIKENMILKILEYISKVMKLEINQLDITVLVNNNKARNLKIILNLAENVKTIKLVTNNEEKFKALEEKMQEIMGILLRITNNKRKGLAKENIIINMDFSEESLNKYTINSNAIIINMQGGTKIRSKRFNGITVNDVNLRIPVNYKLQFARENIYYDFEAKELYEASIYYLDFEVAQKKINKDYIYIDSLVGNSGIINDKEFEEKCKIYVKTIDKTKIFD
ncbi:MAG: hypothetical protein IJ223_00085 [Clostridia bacterium]|nr:hypothetical protein [Clostridia bacterium]